jgi:regulation of enolase protein 1 (concanavalin A-like superfamily)
LYGLGLAASVATPEWEGRDVGEPGIDGSQALTAEGWRVKAAGADWGGTRDQGRFVAAPRTGNFDVRVRVAAIELTDLWAKAGICARDSWDADSRSAAVLTTPTLAGTFLQTRAAPGGNSVAAGSFPANASESWLRLQRRGERFSGYASIDGTHWQSLGSLALGLSNTVWLGVAASSRQTNRLGTVDFAAWEEVTVDAPLLQALPRESVGPSSRRTGLALTEIMYRPPGSDKRLQFVELFNANPFFEDLSGYRLAGDVSYEFPAGTLLPGGSFLVVAGDPQALQATAQLSSVLGPWTGALSGTGNVELRNDRGAVLLQVPYRNQSPWPIAADGLGHSLVLAKPSFGEGSATAWQASRFCGGSPGGLDPMPGGPWENVVINEVLALADSPTDAFVELYNQAREAVDLSGCWIVDQPDAIGFRIPVGTHLQAGGFVTFQADELGFSLPVGGGRLFLVSPTRDRVIDGVDVTPQSPGVAGGLHPDGSVSWAGLARPTPGAPNALPVRSPVIINEIMYHPLGAADEADLEFVELFNREPAAIDLSGWRLMDAIEFEFPAGTVIGGGRHLVVARNRAQLRARYPHLAAIDVAGDFRGRLANDGERLALARPEMRRALEGADAGPALVIVEEVTYGGRGRWSQWADGGGSSLERIDPHASGAWAAHWADSDESTKSAWTLVEATGVLDHGSGAIDQLQLMLLEAGECLVDEVEVRVEGVATNLIANGAFENGIAGWTMLGDHVRSGLSRTAGIDGSACLHLRANNQGEPLANHVFATVRQSSLLAPGKTATLRAKVRWLHGHPEVLLRLKGNYLEAFGRLDIARAPGSPGRPNTVMNRAQGPALAEVTHFPVLPAIDQAVRVTARVDTTLERPPQVTLFYRVDPGTNWVSVPMSDEGGDPDLAAGDGVYSGRIPAPGTSGLAAFYVEASGGASGRGNTTFPANAPQGECLVRFGEQVLASSFGTYRLWFTAATVKAWNARPVLSNDELDGTFVYDNQRVVYNIGARYSGSPWHQNAYASPVTGHTTYAFRLPGDDRVLGTDSFNKLHALGNTPGDDPTLQCEQAAYWMVRQMGLPWNYQRYVVTFVNGNRRGQLMEDTQVPSRDTLQQWFPGHSAGELFKLNGWYEPTSPGGRGFQLAGWCTLNDYTTTDGRKKTARYRWNWAPRAIEESANAYSNLFALIDAANAPQPALAANLTQLADVNQWLRTFAIEHAVGNWDSFGNRNAQNMYAFKATGEAWKLLIWDFNIVLGNSGSDGPSNDSLFQYNTSDSGMARIYAEPRFQRLYLQSLREVVEGPMLNARVDPMLDARYAAFRASGVAASSPAGIKNWISSRRRYVSNYLTNFNVGFALINPTNQERTVAQNWIELTGSAPLEVSALRVNGVLHEPLWTNLVVWQLKLALTASTNDLVIEALDAAGRVLNQGTTRLTVVTDAPIPLPEGQVIINEIMHHPRLPGAEYVELHNRSTSSAFDLTGYRFSGLDLTFPAGSWLPPGGYLVVTKDPSAFLLEHGNAIPLAGSFAGNLAPSGERLRLLRPSAIPGEETVVDEVTYGTVSPWPEAANSGGVALQFIDPQADNARPENWGVLDPESLSHPEWKFVSVTGPATGSRLLVYHSPFQPELDPWDFSGRWEGAILVPGDPLAMGLSMGQTVEGGWSGELFIQGGVIPLSPVRISNRTNITFALDPRYGIATWQGRLSADGNAITGTFSQSVQGQTVSFPFRLERYVDKTVSRGGSVLIDDLRLEVGRLVGGSPNLVRNGDFESPLTEVWMAASNHQASTIASEAVHTGQGSLRLVASRGGGDVETAFWQLLDPLLPGQTYTLSYWYLPSAQGNELTVRTEGNDLIAQHSIRPGQPATPGRRNTAERSLAPEIPDTPLVRINEWQASNTATLREPVRGRYEDWIELYNAGSAAADLSGWFLTDDLANPRKWSFPLGTRLEGSGYLLIWADEHSELNGGGIGLHTNFKLSQQGEAIGLSDPQGRWVDVVTFGPQQSDVSQGRSPDGAPEPWASMTEPTPGGPNPGIQIQPHPPVITRLHADSAGGLLLAWQSGPGAVYQVQYRDELGGGTWMDASGPLEAVGPETIFRPPRPLAIAMRFYRIACLRPAQAAAPGSLP